MARRLDDPLCFLRVTGTVYQGQYTPLNLADRLSDLGLAVSLAEKMGDVTAGFHANYCRAVACLQAADRARLDLHVDAANALAERMGETFPSWAAMVLASMRSLLAGDVDRAQREAEAAYAIGAQGVPEAMASYAAQLLEVHGIRGQWTELAAIAELIAGAAAENPGLPVLRGALARTYGQLGRDDEARTVIEDDIANGFAAFPEDNTWMSAMTVLSEICIRLGRADGAALLYDRLLPWHEQVPTVGVTSQGPVAFYLGGLAALLGKPDEAQGHFGESLEISEKLVSPYWVARTQVEGRESTETSARPLWRSPSLQRLLHQLNAMGSGRS